QYNPIRTTF
nr:Chain C, Paired mesoderm homeobox protein 2B peptide [Homo sapiens]8EK5_C Chain C, Paired mesoderm homeobox protein 2B peptide [Homo sapiens]